MTKEQQLKPCPFCGPGQSVVSLLDDLDEKYWYVSCGRCGASSGKCSVRLFTDARTKAVETWNSRPSVDALEAEVARLREVLKEVSLPPYPDSDLTSLLETLRVRARAALSPEAPAKLKEPK